MAPLKSLSSYSEHVLLFQSWEHSVKGSDWCSDQMDLVWIRRRTEPCFKKEGFNYAWEWHGHIKHDEHLQTHTRPTHDRVNWSLKASYYVKFTLKCSSHIWNGYVILTILLVPYYSVLTLSMRNSLHQRLLTKTLTNMSINSPFCRVGVKPPRDCLVLVSF